MGGEVFEEDGDALHWFVAEWSLVGRELESVNEFVCQGGRRLVLRRRLGFVLFLEAVRQDISKA